MHVYNAAVMRRQTEQAARLKPPPPPFVESAQLKLALARRRKLQQQVDVMYACAHTSCVIQVDQKHALRQQNRTADLATDSSGDNINWSQMDYVDEENGEVADALSDPASPLIDNNDDENVTQLTGQESSHVASEIALDKTPEILVPAATRVRRQTMAAVRGHSPSLDNSSTLSTSIDCSPKARNVRTEPPIVMDRKRRRDTMFRRQSSIAVDVKPVTDNDEQEVCGMVS
jgi:hypothetical protein